MKGLKWNDGLGGMNNRFAAVVAWLVGGAVLVWLGVFGVGTGACAP
jgi:hypothetical protein